MPTATEELNRLLSIPPPHCNNNSNPTAIAHAAFQALRDSGDEQFLFLRVLLERQATEETLFHCILGVRHVILWKWRQQFSLDFLCRVRTLLLVWGQQQQESFSRTCCRACTTTAAAWWKRGWNDTAVSSNTAMSPSEQAVVALFPNNLPTALDTPDQLLAALESQFQQNTTSAGGLSAACLCWETLVTECSGPSTAVQYRMPLEFHTKLHQQVGGGPLIGRALHCTVNVLHDPSRFAGQQPNDELNALLQLLTAVLQWDTSGAAWDAHATPSSVATSSASYIRLPAAWRDYLVVPLPTVLVPLLCHNIWDVPAAHEVLLLLASLSGPILEAPADRRLVAQALCDGLVQLLQAIVPVRESAPMNEDMLERTLRVLPIASRTLSNMRLPILLEVASFPALVRAVATAGHHALSGIQQHHDDHHDVPNEVVALVLECTTWLCEDPMLTTLALSTTNSNTSDLQRRHLTQQSLATVLGPLYVQIIQTRLAQAEWEELHPDDSNADDTNLLEHEALEEIHIQDEMEAVASIGRLDLGSAVSCLSSCCASLPLRAVWEQPTTAEVTPQSAAVLEKTRLLVLYATHLLTDTDEGESPSIPMAVMARCREENGVVEQLTQLVQWVLEVADFQRQRLSLHPSNPSLSPFLAQSFLWFLQRWIPAYVDPVDVGPSDLRSPLIHRWIQKAAPTLNLSLSLCIAYQCYWPQEIVVQEAVGTLLLRLAQRDVKLRRHMLASGSAIAELAHLHQSTAGFPHTAPPAALQELSNANNATGPAAGFVRLSYADRARVLTFLLVVWSDDAQEQTQQQQHNISTALQAVHATMEQLVRALQQQQRADTDVHVRELACLCVALMEAVAQTGGIHSSARRIPSVLTPYLPQLSGLMQYYAQDVFVCEALLRFFRDYTAHFLVHLDGPQGRALFQACAMMLESYSNSQCAHRVVVQQRASALEAETEEGQSYNDILCALQLLVNISTKDFLDMCSSSQTGDSSPSQVTDLIFFGLQQILPLMTQGLLQYPALCEQFFELVSTMMDSHPEKVCNLPHASFHPFFDSLLFGMSHQSACVAKGSLRGLASLLRAQFKTGALQGQLQHQPDLVGLCAKRLLSEVVFQPVVRDRMSETSAVLTLLLAADLHKFTPVVQELLTQTPDPRYRPRLEAAFTKLVQPNVISQAVKEGHEGRSARVSFGKLFAQFLDEVHAFMVLR